MDFVYIKQFGTEEPPVDFLGIGYKGNGVAVTPVFVMKGESWFDLGCKYFTKIVDIL